jgi:hypothetical protein
MNAVTLLYLAFALALVNWAIAMASLKSYLVRTRAIASTIDLESFANLARRHMLQALAQIVLLVAGLLLGLYVLATDQAELLQILALNGAIWMAGTLGKPLEERARSLSVPDPLLAERYRAICLSWLKKPFPDF